jgi:hypothetical protein
LGLFVFRHVQKDWFHGYEPVDLGSRQEAFVATPEKALLDLVYLTAGAEDYGFLKELRLQNLEKLDADKLLRLAEMSGSPKLRLAGNRIVQFMADEAGEPL